MECSEKRLARRRWLSVMALGLVGSTTGCGVLPHVAYWLHGPTRKPKEFGGLEGKRVAVVCLDANSLGGPSGEADALALAVTSKLKHNVKKVQMVRPEEIANWMDGQGSDLTDYRDIGRGVKADMVVGIDLVSFSLHEGQTLLKGKARVSVKVYDMAQGGEVVYDSPTKEISWPESGARHVTEDEHNFKLNFLNTLADKIAHKFYDYEMLNDFALDAAHLAD
jgi:hypothetical protein